MPKKSDKKRKNLEEEAFEFVEELTEKLKKAITAEPTLRKKADELSEVMTNSYSKNSVTAKNMKFAVRVLMVADILINEEVEIENEIDMKAVLAMTAETVFGLSRLEAVLFAREVGKDAFEAYKEEREDDTAVYKTLIALSVCLERFKENKNMGE